MSKTVELKNIIRTETGLSLEQIQKFFSETPKEKILTRSAKGGGSWDYVAGSYVTQVLNSLFGFLWSFEVITSMEDAFKTASSGTVVVQGRLRVKIGDEWVTKEQYGRKEVTYKKGTKDLLDFGNDLKAAATDAKKKCASELGLFADVYAKEDFFEVRIVEETENGGLITIDDLLEELKEATTEEEIRAVTKKATPSMKLALASVAENRLKELRNADNRQPA